MRKWRLYLLFLALAGCGDTWNNPYPDAEKGKSILYEAFTERPKHLDPAQSYSEDEAVFNAQIYEPPLQYHYLKRPYELVPLTAERLPAARYYDSKNTLLPEKSAAIAYTVYDIKIRPGIYYQPHPAFARDAQGNPLYLHMGENELKKISSLSDFAKTGTRELIAADYVYEIKRLASPRLNCPIYGLMSEYIVGLREYAATLKQADLASNGKWLDLAAYPLEGAEVVDRYTYRVKIKGKYPQFVYWLAMSFFSPVPFEADRFYSQASMKEKNISLDWYPVGTGPYRLTENNPNSKMVLSRNPNFHGESYPSEGEKTDGALLEDRGKAMPFIDEVVFTREKESIPYWNKFLQGYYDLSGISSDSFDQAVALSVGGEAQVSPDMARQGIELKTSVSTSSRYLAFNMLDSVVGGDSERARLLRQAISIALDYEENISIFANGRGIPAQGPLPPGIFGYRAGESGINPYVYDWDNGAPRRKSVDYARRLLAQAGYPEGREAKTGAPLVLYLDVTGRGADDKTRFDWYRKQFAKLSIQLEIRATDYNRFQEKVRKGSAQMFLWGWNADYPDAENFLFLLHGAQSKVKFGGENSANYANSEYDRLFDQMKNMGNSPERQLIIDRMLEILRRDSPWVWGFHPKDYQLNHGWLKNLKPNQMARNNVKYQRIDAELRERKRLEWNRPAYWPFAALAAFFLLLVIPAVRLYLKREAMAVK